MRFSGSAQAGGLGAVRTLAELEQLPVGAVVVDVNTCAAQLGAEGWYQAGGHQAYPHSVFANVLPVQVVWLS